MGSSFPDFSSLRNDTDQARLDLIWTDLDVCLTFATVAETAYSMRHREHAERTLASAEKGYSDMVRLFTKATRLTPEAEEKFQLKFREVRERLDGVQKLALSRNSWKA